ncbi:MAG: transporter [Bacteroidia bacterium]|nr:transporter [Bacteroidia bacterium]
MKVKSLLILFLALFAIIFQSQSQTIETDRPDQTESSSVIPGQSLQVESGMVLCFREMPQHTERQILAPTTLFRYAPVRGFEVRLVNQFEHLEGGNEVAMGVSDLELGTKIQLLKRGDINCEVAVLSHVVFPTGSRELTGNCVGTVNKLLVSHAFGENLSLGYNLGYNYFGSGRGDGTYSMALGVGVTEKVGIYVEPYGEWVNFRALEANFDAGMTYLLRENLQLDFSFGTGLNQRMNYLSVGFSWNSMGGKGN